MNIKSKKLNKNDTLRHLLKAKELALQGPLEHLDQQFEEGQYDKNLKAKISKDLAEECRQFTKKKVKQKIRLSQLNEIVHELRDTFDSEDSRNLSDAVIPLEGDTLLYVPLKFSSKLRRRSLIDTGACSSAIPESLYTELMTDANVMKTLVKNAKCKTVRMASGKSLPVLGEIVLKLFIHDSEFEETFMILPTMNSVILGSPFFQNIK